MAVAFGFSFGDFVGGILLVKDLINALQESKGGKADYRNLMNELYSLERAMVAIKEISLEETSTEYKIACHAIAGASSLKDVVKRVRWALCRQEDVSRLRESLAVQTTTINLLLNILSLSGSTSQGLKVTSGLEKQTVMILELQEKLQDKSLEQMELLRRIENLLPSGNKLTPKGEFLVRPLRLIGAPISPGFVERPDIMQAIEKSLLPPDCKRQKILVLQGMGGIGKSQMAREVAIVHQSVYTSIFWANAMSEDTLRSSYSQIAEQIPLPGALNINGRVGNGAGEIAIAIRSVLNWLEECENNRWLLICDNADNQTQGSDDQSNNELQRNAYNIYDYIPQSSHGTILLTSRVASLARYLGGTAIRIEAMNISESLYLLAKTSSRPLNEPGALEIVQKLSCYPIALSQAGKYIFENQIGSQKYLENYNNRLSFLLKQNPNKREYEHGSISTTLMLSYDKLKVNNPTAAAFLSMCAYLSNGDIAWDLLRRESTDWGAVKSPPCLWIPHLPENWLDLIRDSEEDFNESVRALHELSFVRRNEEVDSVTIHPVVHEWLARSNDPNARSQFLSVVADILAFNLGGYIAGPESRSIPHVDRCLELSWDQKEWWSWRTSTLYFLAVLYFNMSRRHDAWPIIQRLLQRLNRNDGEWDSSTCRWRMHTMTIALHATPINVHLYHLQKIRDIIPTLNVSGLETAELYADLGIQSTFAYLVQGNVKIAMTICQEVINGLLQTRLDRRFLICSTAMQAECHLASGNHDQALTSAKTALELFKKHYGTEHPEDTGILEWLMRIKMLLAMAHAWLGQDDLAGLHFASVVAAYQATRGPDHALTRLAGENSRKSRQGALAEMETDLQIPYMRWDLAMGVFTWHNHFDLAVDAFKDLNL
ncbi:MAG: hypothetical protein Q9167_004212 [Letrouitia subvulpina]